MDQNCSKTPDCEWLKLPTVNSQTTEHPHRKWQINEQTRQDKFKTKKINKENLWSNNKFNLEADYFLAGSSMEIDKAKNTKTAIEMHKQVNYGFVGTGWFKGIFSLKIRHKGVASATKICSLCTTRTSLKKIETKGTADTGTTKGRWNDKMVQHLCNAKTNGEVWLCLDSARLNQALKWPVHRGPTLNDKLKLTNAHYMTKVDASSGNHNLKPDFNNPHS